jgi:hypothetical protein
MFVRFVNLNLTMILAPSFVLKFVGMGTNLSWNVMMVIVMMVMDVQEVVRFSLGILVEVVLLTLPIIVLCISRQK